MNRDEFSLIESIHQVLGSPSKRVLTGIGDDAAILEATERPLLFCSDVMAEGVHFDLKYTSPYDLGYKALASCLSDIAAMNGTPLYALLSLALPKNLANDFLEQFYRGVKAIANWSQVDIVGGDLTSSRGGIFIDVSCVGEAAHPKRRSGARVGDWIAVSGHLGASAAGLFALQQSQPGYEMLKKCHLNPLPRFDRLPALNTPIGLCTALIDISDGLSSELHHIAQSSGVGFEIEASRLPYHPEAITLAHSLDQELLPWALSGGEDYELLATLNSQIIRSPDQAPAGFTIIGRITSADHGHILIGTNGNRSSLTASGFNHFR